MLPYDLTSSATILNGVDTMTLLPQFEYLVAKNCSLRARQFACTLLEPECSIAPLAARLPCFDFCRGISKLKRNQFSYYTQIYLTFFIIIYTAVMDGCEGDLPRELLSLMQCKNYPRINCVRARSPCFERELTCGDGSCISRDWICDGHRDCPNGEDEASCVLCSRDEFRYIIIFISSLFNIFKNNKHNYLACDFSCPSGGCILKRWLCDGYADCPKGEDELENTCLQAGVERSEDHHEVGEESAASVLAPSVKKLNRVPPPQHYVRTNSPQGR